MNFKGKTALITGGAQGIGRAISLKLASLGANIVIFDIPQSSAAQSTCDEINQISKAVVVLGDVRNADDVKNAVDTAVEKFGTLDILVNNAGITKDTLLFKMDEKMWDDVLEINLKGSFLFSKAALRMMSKQRRGKIVNLSSVVGIMGNAGQANYSASKAGLIGLTKSLAKEFASRNINCNAVAPGFIRSNMTDGLSDSVRADYLKGIPLNRFGTVEDVANVVTFLCSDMADYVTGQVIHIDGGLVM